MRLHHVVKHERVAWGVSVGGVTKGGGGEGEVGSH
jgi:hypothetical protein